MLKVAAASQRAVKEEAGETINEDEFDVPYIRFAHFEEAMSRARRSVSEADIVRYKGKQIQILEKKCIGLFAKNKIWLQSLNFLLPKSQFW